MKKGRIALMTLLAVCVALVLSMVPTSVFATQTTAASLTGTKLTASHAGQTLQAGEYYVEPNTTLKLTGGTGKSGLKVADGATVTIYIPADSKLYVTGGAASGTTGAGAGIEVNTGSTLKITGAGELYAYGGKAANGSNGGNGDAADWVDDGRSYIPDGGYGGAGGGGAGAGIGTKGGAGGSGTGWTLGFSSITNRYQDTEGFVNTNISGRRGSNGGNGASATACGAIYISNDIKYTAAGGAQGTSGGSGGSRGSYDYESDNHWMRGLAGGAGGGGGGAGKAGASIGTGGGGGGGGGAGGGVGYAWSYQFLGAGGGGGGAGAVGGSGGAWGYDGTVPDCKQFQYFNGKQLSSTSGSSGGTSSGGSGGQGAKVKITDWSGKTWQYPYGGTGGTGGAAGANSSTVEVKKLYRVSLVVEDETIGVYNASANGFLPATIEVPTKAGYTFEGFYAGEVAYYDANGARTSAEVTADMTISAKFNANSYQFGVESAEGSTGGGANVSGSVQYGEAITLTTPQRAGYLFRGWKISAINGTINETAYYTFTAVSRMRTAGQISTNFVHEDGVAMTAGFETIGDSITVYNLSADENAQIKIEEVWVKDSFTVTFKDFDGSILGTTKGTYGTGVNAPALPDNQNDYYTYTFKYWKCNIDGGYYTSEELPYLGYFLSKEATLGDQVYDGVIFTAVYEISEYKKEIHFVGSLGNTLNSDGKLVLNSTDTNVDIVTNFKITKNDGVAALLLIPQYDASVFSIKAISVNGVQFGVGASSTAVLDGFDVTVTNDLNSPVKILLDNITPDSSTSDEIFIQIIYVMNTAVGGEYDFGFVTKTPTDTDHITHGDRSEAYGTYDPDANEETDAYKFNELKITVDSTAIQVVIRATGAISIAPDQSFAYNGQQMSAADVTEMIEKALQYTYNGFGKKEDDTLTITWYDAQGNPLSEVPKNVGTYMIGISAAETTYYTATAEVRATFTIAPYEIIVSAGNQSVVYTGNNAVIHSAASQGGIYVRDAQSNLIPADAFVLAELELIGVELQGSYLDAGTYANAIQGILSGSNANYTVVYENGTLTITKAENGWIVAPADKREEYSGNTITIDEASAKFGDVEIKYGIYLTDANGDKVLSWSETAPTDAGIYPVQITVTGNDNYSGLEYTVTLEISKKVIFADGFTFEAIDKYYNGENQYWSTDPNGDKNSNDTEMTLITSDANAAVLQYIKFAGILTPENCKNAGIYTIQAVLQISNLNYTFVKDGEEVDSWTYDVSAQILKRKIVVVVGDQTAEYTGSEPTVSQGQGYVTITLEDGTVPTFVTQDFFGGQETLTLQKAAGVNAGQYALTATLHTENSNYELVAVTNGIFTITKKLIAVPTLGTLTYNGQVKRPAVPAGFETIYAFSGEGKDVGYYQVTAALLDKANYAWEGDETMPSTSDNIQLSWNIRQKTITLVYPDADQSYAYGTSLEEILEALGDPAWKNGDGPFAGDNDVALELLHVFYSQDTYPVVGNHALQIDQGAFNSNYLVLIEGGQVTVTKKELTQNDLKDQISAVIKYYTGTTLVMGTDDFRIHLFDYNNDTQEVFYVTAVNLYSADVYDYVNANGWMEDSAFTYYDAERKLYVIVTVDLTEEAKANYTLEEDANTFDVEAYIAKAENSWTSSPAVDATTITNIRHSAEALFGGREYSIGFYADAACQIPVTGALDANTTYYAKFTVSGTDNYCGLETVIVFSGGYVTVLKPIVTMDGNVVTEVTTITYDGQVHTFLVPASNEYTVTYVPTGDWKNAGTYTVTIALNSNHAWEDGSVEALVYTLTINKKDLTITAENNQITYGDAAPAYGVTADGLVNGETLEGLLAQTLANYIQCAYTQGNSVGAYEIQLLDSINAELTNYNVTLRNGALTVVKLVFSYDDIVSSDETDGKTFADLIIDGPTFIYDGVSKEVSAEELPDALEITIVYKDTQGNVLPGKPENAGEYTVEIQVTVKDGLDPDNYDIPADAQIQLIIEKAQITITVGDQAYDYDGNDQSGKIPSGSYEIVVNNGQTLTGNVTLTINGSYIHAGVYADKISATHAFDTNNYVVTIVNGDLTIRKVNNAWVADLNVKDDIVYDKNVLQSGVDFSSDPKFGDQDIQYTFYEKIGDNWVQLSGTPTQAGEYAVVAVVPETNNYNELVSQQVYFTIGKATITLGDIRFENATVTYNGQQQWLWVSGEADVLALFNVSYQGNGQINAGVYPVTAIFQVADARNYELDGENTKQAELTIAAVRVTITAVDNSSKYGEVINALTYRIVFDGDQAFADFYTNDFGMVMLSTEATSRSNVGTYDITISYTQNSNYQVTVEDGIYTIEKYENNKIVDLTASDVNYLMDLIYSASAERGTVVFTFSTTVNGTYTSVLPKNVGTYYVKATVPGTENYNGAEAIVSFQINKATLSAISGISYNADTATWTAVVTTTDGKQIDCDVTYLVDGNYLTAPSFTATKAGQFTVTAVASDAANYENSAAVALDAVYSVTFADKVANHDKQQNLADLTGAAFATQYRFAGQAVTRPEKTPEVVGYTFRAWQLDNNDYGFAVGVTKNITLYAAWTVNRYTLTFYNEVVTGSSIVNGVFQEGVISTEQLITYTVEYGAVFNLAGVTTPTKAADEIYTYFFAYWADAIRGNDLGNTITVYDDMGIYAVYGSTAKQFTITYMVAIDGGAYVQHDVVTLPYGAELVSLGEVAWFLGDAWYTDATRQNAAPAFVPAGNMTLYGAYVFDIGAGDVNADGKVNTDDIVNYRRWVVGGYNIVTVEAGTEWSLVTSDAYDASAIYYLVRVSDANRDDSGDIRDITTIRMALTGGYGYEYVSGRDSAAGVTGEGVVIPGQHISNASTPEALKAALEKGGFIQLTGNVTFTETVTINKDAVIYLNGHSLDMSSNGSRPFEMASDAKLIIYAENAIVKVGKYGLVSIPASADNVSVVLHGGTYLANTDKGSFIKPRGTGKISIELYDVNLTDTSKKNWALDASSYAGDALSVKVEGGTYNVWAGFVFDGPATNQFVLNNVTIHSRYQGVTVGGDDSTCLPENAGYVTVNNCTIDVQVDLQKDKYSAEMGCVIAGYGAQIEVTDSNLSSNIHIASICSGNGNSTIALNDCAMTAGDTYEQYKFYDEGSILVDGENQAVETE